MLLQDQEMERVHCDYVRLVGIIYICILIPRKETNVYIYCSNEDGRALTPILAWDLVIRLLSTPSIKGNSYISEL